VNYPAAELQGIPEPPKPKTLLLIMLLQNILSDNFYRYLVAICSINF
jgi:hypothetical protein